MYKKLLTRIIGAAILLVAFSGCGTQSAEALDYDTNASNTLTIAALHVDGFLEVAARRFEEIHDGQYTVNIIPTGDFTSYTQIVNTALMSGGGEDIIMASNLAWQRLADVGRLVDLNSKMDFPQGKYYQGVMDAFIYNGGRYVIPFGFSLGAWAFTDLVPYSERPNQLTLSNLMALAEANPDDLIFGTASGLGSTPASIALMYFNLNFAEFIDLANRIAHVDDDKFIALLENVQSISHNIRPNQMGEVPLIWEDMLFSPAMASSGTRNYSEMILSTNDSGQSLVNSHFLMAVNANSQNQALAARFITFILSEEMQTSPELWSNPINKNAAAQSAALTLESVRAGGFAPTDFDLEENIRIFNAMASQATVFGTSDPFINDFVSTEMTRFFDGELTAQQAASNLQARLTTYLNE